MKTTSLILAALCLLGGHLAGAESNAARRPNILLIIVDQQFRNVELRGEHLRENSNDGQLGDGWGAL